MQYVLVLFVMCMCSCTGKPKVQNEEPVRPKINVVQEARMYPPLSVFKLCPDLDCNVDRYMVCHYSAVSEKERLLAKKHHREVKGRPETSIFAVPDSVIAPWKGPEVLQPGGFRFVEPWTLGFKCSGIGTLVDVR